MINHRVTNQHVRVFSGNLLKVTCPVYTCTVAYTGLFIIYQNLTQSCLTCHPVVIILNQNNVSITLKTYLVNWLQEFGRVCLRTGWTGDGCLTNVTMTRMGAGRWTTDEVKKKIYDDTGYAGPSPSFWYNAVLYPRWLCDAQSHTRGSSLDSARIRFPGWIRLFPGWIRFPWSRRIQD